MHIKAVTVEKGAVSYPALLSAAHNGDVHAGACGRGSDVDGDVGQRSLGDYSYINEIGAIVIAHTLPKPLPF